MIKNIATPSILVKRTYLDLLALVTYSFLVPVFYDTIVCSEASETNSNFEKIRQEGSHIFFKHSDGRTTVVPNHPGKDIGRGLMRVIIDEIKLTPSEFQKLV